MRLKPFAFAFGAAHEKVAQKLHLNFLVARARAALAAAAAGIKRECARGEPLRHCFRLSGKQFANTIVKPQIKQRRRSGRPRKRSLIDHEYIPDAMRSGNRFACTRLACRAVVLRWVVMGRLSL